MRKILGIFLALVLMLTFSLVTVVSAAPDKPNKLHVGYGTIQAAVDAAQPGDTIIVHAGTYNESVVISTDDISLKGEAGAILDGTDLGNVNAITLSANGVTIRGFEIRDYGGQGIRADGTIGTPLSGITLRHLNIHDVGSFPGGHGHAIDIRNAADVMIKQVTVAVGPGAVSWAEGIRLQSIVGVQVINADVDGGVNGVNFALSTEAELGPPTSGVVKGSTFANNSFISVFIAHSTDATIVGNEITDAALFGIYAGWGTGVSGITIKGNEVSGSGVYGITLSGATNSEVSKNTVTGSGSDGIALYAMFGGTSNNQVEKNKVSSSSRYGISLRGEASDNLIKKNKVSGSGTFDLHWDGSGSGNTWEKNVYGTSNLP